MNTTVGAPVTYQPPPMIMSNRQRADINYTLVNGVRITKTTGQNKVDRLQK